MIFHRSCGKNDVRKTCDEERVSATIKARLMRHIEFEAQAPVKAGILLG